jgi:hypothetical protein
LLAKKYPAVSVSPDIGLMEIAKSTGDPHVMDFADIIYSSTFRDRRLSSGQIMRLHEILEALKNSSKKDAEVDA